MERCVCCLYAGTVLVGDAKMRMSTIQEDYVAHI